MFLYICEYFLKIVEHTDRLIREADELFERYRAAKASGTTIQSPIMPTPSPANVPASSTATTSARAIARANARVTSSLDGESCYKFDHVRYDPILN